jgi:hypothetical protein
MLRNIPFNACAMIMRMNIVCNQNLANWKLGEVTAPNLAPQVLANRRGVAFVVERALARCECTVSIAALETYLWLDPAADETRILKTFRKGYGRIRAIAERKLLAHPSTRIGLTSADFAHS